MIRRPIALLAALLGSGAAWAGPPYVTDDPEPTDLGKWEIYGFGTGTRLTHATEGATGFDINYGAARDLQLTTVIEVDHQRGGTDGNHSGFGNMEVGAKYRVLHQKEGSWLPDVSFFPKLDLPTAGKRFGSGKLGAQLPLWAQKDIGAWSLFGGGGYVINPGADQRDFWQTGLAFTRMMTTSLSLGGEVYHRTADADDGHSSTGLGMGASWQVAPHWSLIGSGGPIIQHRDSTGQYAFYLALEFHN